MPSHMVNATLQAVALSALSNVLAQGLQAYQKNVSRLPQGMCTTSADGKTGTIFIKPGPDRPIRYLYTVKLPTQHHVAAVPRRDVPGIRGREGRLQVVEQDEYCEEICAGSDGGGMGQHGYLHCVSSLHERQGQRGHTEGGQHGRRLDVQIRRYDANGDT
jgi:hypothetical protein